MIDKKQKAFTTEFGVDENIEVVSSNFKGSRGYVSEIQISRNGIYYEVILTQFVTNFDIIKPKKVNCSSYMLKSIEQEDEPCL